MFDKLIQFINYNYYTSLNYKIKIESCLLLNIYENTLSLG